MPMDSLGTGLIGKLVKLVTGTFFLGYLSPMLLQLKTGRVPGYDEGQEPFIYLVSSAQVVAAAGILFVFSDGHWIAAFTDWYDDLSQLDKADSDKWKEIYLIVTTYRGPSQSYPTMLSKAGESSVSLDLLVRSLLALNSRRDN